MKDPVVVNLDDYLCRQEMSENKQAQIDNTMEACVDEVIKVMTYHDYSTVIDSLNNDELGTLLQIAVVEKNIHQVDSDVVITELS